MAPIQQQMLLCMSLLLSLLTTTTIAQSPTIATTANTVTSSSSANLAIPSCAASCIGKASSSQSCAPSDQSCLCSASTQIQESITTCLTTSTCSDAEKSAAIDYYPEYCASLNLAVESGVPTVIASAGGSAPSKTGDSAHNPTTTVHSSATETTTITADSNTSDGGNNSKNLGLPAILGITLAAIVVVIAFAALMVWSILRRRYIRSHHGPRRDLGDEFVQTQPRPARSKSIKSDFMVQPSPVEKEDEFGRSLSRTSTLVPPPPIAKDEDKRSSQEKRNSARNKALNLLLGGNERLRASFMSGRSSTKRPSLVVPPLNISKAEEEELRISKF